MKKMLVTGVTGFVGARIAEMYKDSFEVVRIDRATLDFTDRDRVFTVFDEMRPDIFIHCGAISDMGVCDAEPEESYKINTLGPSYIAEAAAQNGTKLLFCSSDQVYNGTEGFEPFKETDNLTPVNTYAKEKLEAEQRIADLCPEAVSLRLSWMYDYRKYSDKEHGNLYLSLKAAVENNSELVWSDIDFRGITYLGAVSANIEKAVELPGGAYNFGSPNTLSSYELVRFAVKLLGGNPMKVKRTGISDKTNLPRSLRMDQSKLNAAGIVFPTTAEGFELCRKAETNE